MQIKEWKSLNGEIVTQKEFQKNRRDNPEVSGCQCKEACLSRGNTFVCASCGRKTAYCFGADDQYRDDCDACAVLKMKISGEFYLREGF